MLLAAALAALVALAFTRVLDGSWPESAIFDLDQTATTFPSFFLTTSAAVQAAASPFLSAPMRKVGWSLILGAAATGVIGAVTTASDVTGALRWLTRHDDL